MELKKFIKVTNKILYQITQKTNLVGSISLTAMMLLVTADVSLRYFFLRPIRGSNEIIQFMMVILIFFGMAYSAILKGHITLDILVPRFSKRVQAIINIIASLLSSGVILVMAWRTAVQAGVMQRSGVVSDFYPIPVFPFMLAVTFGLGLFFLVVLLQLIESIDYVIKNNREGDK